MAECLQDWQCRDLMSTRVDSDESLAGADGLMSCDSRRL